MLKVRFPLQVVCSCIDYVDKRLSVYLFHFLHCDLELHSSGITMNRGCNKHILFVFPVNGQVVFIEKNTFTLLKPVFCAALSKLVSVITKCPAAEGIICHQISQWYYDCKKATEINIVGILCNNSLSKNCRKPKFPINKN